MILWSKSKDDGLSLTIMPPKIMGHDQGEIHDFAPAPDYFFSVTLSMMLPSRRTALNSRAVGVALTLQ